MTENIQAFPLDWPIGWKRTSSPKRSAFKNDKTIDKSVKELLHELSLMKATKIIISTNIPIRKDGLPYSSFRAPDDKGAAVYFNLKGNPHVMACDKWDRLEHNIWAIAKHIETLRAQERWGVGNIEQAFAGFKALPQYASEDSGDPWWKTLSLPSPSHNKIKKEDIEFHYRILAKKYHPDVPGGSAEMMTKLNMAKEQGLKSIQEDLI
jgi:hypothetical protein